MKKQIKNLLITGGAGYVGSTLIRDALADGYFVRCLDHLVYGGKAIIGFMNHPNFEFIHGDIRDKDSIRNCFDRFQPDVVINTAAIKHVPICETNSIESVKTNILGHQNVIESIPSEGQDGESQAHLVELIGGKKDKHFVPAAQAYNYAFDDHDVIFWILYTTVRKNRAKKP